MLSFSLSRTVTSLPDLKVPVYNSPSSSWCISYLISLCLAFRPGKVEFPQLFHLSCLKAVSITRCGKAFVATSFLMYPTQSEMQFGCTSVWRKKKKALSTVPVPQRPLRGDGGSRGIRKSCWSTTTSNVVWPGRGQRRKRRRWISTGGHQQAVLFSICSAEVWMEPIDAYTCMYMFTAPPCS